jgi:hypothetical protein
MANTKGTDVVGLRKIFAEAGQQAEQKLLDRLTPEQRHIYENAVSTTLSPVGLQTELYERAAETLFPEDPNRMVRLGKIMANRSYSTVYKLFFRIPTVEFLISRVATVWRSYYDSGEAEIRNFTGRSGSLVVRHFPSLPRKLREVIAGHLTVILELTGAKSTHVLVCDDDPEAWEWKLTWG